MFAPLQPALPSPLALVSLTPTSFHTGGQVAIRKSTKQRLLPCPRSFFWRIYHFTSSPPSPGNPQSHNGLLRPDCRFCNVSCIRAAPTVTALPASSCVPTGVKSSALDPFLWNSSGWPLVSETATPGIPHHYHGRCALRSQPSSPSLAQWFASVHVLPLASFLGSLRMLSQTEPTPTMRTCSRMLEMI